MNEAARLRLVLLGGIVLVLACIELVYWRLDLVGVAMSARHWLVIVVALWTGISRFSLQPRMVNRPARATRFLRSTPFTHCRTGHLVRLCTAMSVGV